VIVKKNLNVAYFCMEYGLDKDCKLYSGGLGILAGDHMKSAHDLNAPLVGIGIKWKQGYGDQVIDERNAPDCRFYDSNFDFLKETGVKVTVEVEGRVITCKVWKLDAFGNNPIYLLDTDLPENGDCSISNRLYAGSSHERVAQEIVLGIGGVRALRALNIPVNVYHFNEGHAVPAAIELIREKREKGAGYADALTATREECVFTTHTPVMAGNEEHQLDTLGRMGAFNGLDRSQMEALGGSPFNMTVAALRLSRKANAVAKLHAETARQMWAWIEDKPDIIPITNGVHRATWTSASVAAAYRAGNGLWDAHMAEKQTLIDFIKEKNDVALDPDKLLIGFARRAAAYKRSDLIFRNQEAADALFKSGQLQIVFAGKSHPANATGKLIISRLLEMSRRHPEQVVFLENYDMEIGAKLTRGADVWLNNPVRPKEACGTSGMKAAMNGVLNCSVLDGWWPEACKDGINGWQIGDGKTAADVDNIDWHDGQSLHDTLINKIIPAYYDNRNKWVEMMKASIADTITAFSADRMLEQYYSELYS